MVCVTVVTTFTRAGAPLANSDHMTKLLEEHGYGLSNQCGMCDLIPFVQSEEQQQIRAEQQWNRISVIFNGATQLREFLCRQLHD